LKKIDIYLSDNFRRIAAFIAEPLVQGANGMMMYRAEFLNKLVKLLKTYNILIILDEVMTGFGRTGKNFAFNYCNFTPDMICLSKGLTGGFLPMALTITSKEIYNAFLDDNYSKAFSHGHSYTANPLGCIAGIASLDLLLLDETQEKITEISRIHKYGLSLINDDFVENKRLLGTISAFSIKNCINYKEIGKNFLKAGLLIRPLGKECYILPPYCIDLDELLDAYREINKILKNLYVKNE
jgi:adenosylmethionine-8-amino-7-oxononanoate aminotransferase